MKILPFLFCLLPTMSSLAQGSAFPAVSEVKPIDGSLINTELKETSPAVSHDGETIYFARPSGEGGNKVWFSRMGAEKWGLPVEMALPNSPGMSVMQILNRTGERDPLLLLRSESEKGDPAYCLSTNGKNWGKPKKIKIKKTPDLHGAECFLTPDRKQLMVSLAIEGGRGGRDLYLCRALGEGKFDAPINLGDVNSEADETSPFLADDGTLYFASNRKDSKGKNDIYAAAKVMGNPFRWDSVANMGDKINTAFDETHFTISSYERAYFSREAADGNADIYQAALGYEEQSDMAKIAGKTLDKNSGLPLAAIVAAETVEGQWVNMTDNNPATGEFVLEVPKNEKYNVYCVVGNKRSKIVSIDLTSKSAEVDALVIYYGEGKEMASIKNDLSFATPVLSPAPPKKKPKEVSTTFVPAGVERVKNEVSELSGLPLDEKPKEVSTTSVPAGVERVKNEVSALSGLPLDEKPKEVSTTSVPAGVEGVKNEASALSGLPLDEKPKEAPTTSVPVGAERVKNEASAILDAPLDEKPKEVSTTSVPAGVERVKNEASAILDAPPHENPKEAPTTSIPAGVERVKNEASAILDAPLDEKPKEVSTTSVPAGVERVKNEASAILDAPPHEKSKEAPTTSVPAGVERVKNEASAILDAPPHEKPKEVPTTSVPAGVERVKNEVSALSDVPLDENPKEVSTTSVPAGIERVKNEASAILDAPPHENPKEAPTTSVPAGVERVKNEVSALSDVPLDEKPKEAPTTSVPAGVERVKNEASAILDVPLDEKPKEAPSVSNPAAINRTKNTVQANETAAPDSAIPAVFGNLAIRINKVLFETNKSAVSQEYFEPLDRIAALAKQTSRIVHLAGYADTSGHSDRNMTLSKKRAQAVARYLIEKGVPASQIEAEYYGEKNSEAPSVPDSRRVEINLDENKANHDIQVINFAFDSDIVRDSDNVLLDRIAKHAQTLELSGFTDSTGPNEHNLNLSKRRAKSVAQALINRGVPPERIVTKYYGAEKPIDSAIRSKNRRVEIRILD